MMGTNESVRRNTGMRSIWVSQIAAGTGSRPPLGADSADGWIGRGAWQISDH